MNNQQGDNRQTGLVAALTFVLPLLCGALIAIAGLIKVWIEYGIRP